MRTPLLKILIVKQRGIGDIVLSTPVLRSIRCHFKDAWITLVVDHPSAELFLADPDIDEIVEIRRSPLALMQALSRICGRYGIAFDLISTPFSLLLSLISGARIRIGWAKPGRKRALLYTFPIDISRSIPAVDANLRALAPLGIEPATRTVGLHFSDEERSRARKRMQKELSLDINRLMVIVHPGSLFETKRWFPERFAALADRLQERGYQVVITGSKEESETVRVVVASAGRGTKYLSPTSLREFVLFLGAADVAIVNDGGVLHMAQAAGTKTCAIFGSTDPLIWFPYPVPESGDYVYAGLECSPCGRKRCDSLSCLKDITVDRVVEKALAVMATAEKERGCFT